VPPRRLPPPGRCRNAWPAALVAVALLAACTGGAPSDAAPGPPGSTPGQGSSGGPVATSDPNFPAATERDLAGDPRWDVFDGSDRPVVEGFPDRQSVAPGEQVTLYVNAKVPSWTVRAYRMGWYRGDRARLVWTSDPQPGRVQPAPPPPQSGTNLVQTGWTPSLTVGTLGWPPGAYLFRIDPSTGTPGRFVPLTVRSPSVQGALVLLNANANWQAYNKWGGYSTYAGANGSMATRARVVSFDRPYDAGGGAADFLGEAQVIAQAEKLGLKLAYLTDVDLHEQPDVLTGANGVISLLHDEYYSNQMRAALTRARDRGTNIAFLGANAMYRKIRFERSPLGPNRLMINYKDASDPIADRSQATTQWRAPPASDPENSLTGTLYQCNPVRGDLVVVNPGHWLFAGLNLTPGVRIPGLLGSEYDRSVLGGSTPRPMEVLIRSPVTCQGKADLQHSAYYTTASGAGVFNSGTSDWAAAVIPDARLGDIKPEAARIVTAATSTLFTTFAAGPAGRVHPAQDNLEQYGR